MLIFTTANSVQNRSSRSLARQRRARPRHLIPTRLAAAKSIGAPTGDSRSLLARLELAMTEVFDEVETPALSAAAVAAVPPERWPEVRLRPIAAFRLLALRYPVNAYVASVGGKAHRPPRPRRRDAWLLVFRRDYSVRRLELTRPGYDLLSELAAGRTLGDAVTAAARRRGAAARHTELHRWFRQWMASGLFAGLEGLEPRANRS
jgi:hypothetical protein